MPMIGRVGTSARRSTRSHGEDNDENGTNGSELV